MGIPLVELTVGNCAGSLLIYAFLGLVFGVAWGTTPYWSRRSTNIVLTARYYADHPPRIEKLPSFPKASLGSLLGMWFPILKGWCPGILSHHAFFCAGLTLLTLSSAACLLVTFVLQQAVETERLARIERFMADASAPVPPRVPGMDLPPRWLRSWTWANLGGLALLIAVLSKSLIVAVQTGLG